MKVNFRIFLFGLFLFLGLFMNAQPVNIYLSENNMEDEYAYFDLYFRRIPDNGGFVIVAGLEEVVKYIQNLKFDEKDIEYFKSKNMFSEKFLDYLRNFKFECDVWAMPEGSVAFPNEPFGNLPSTAARNAGIKT